MPFGIQPLHIVVIVVVALIIFGPSRLPEIGRGLGKALNEFRKGTREMTEGFRDEVTKPAENLSAPTASATPVAPAQPQTGGGNFCAQCGASNPPDSKFCNKCGAQLPA
jgi:TatA/E family protein of Tat protein translocase